MKEIKGFFIFLTSVFTQITYADLPVIDPVAIAELQKQVTHLENLKQLHSDSLDELKAHTNALKGNYGIGQKHYDMNLPAWGVGTSTLQSGLNLYQQTNSGKLGANTSQLHSEFPIHAKTIASPNPASIDSKTYELQAKAALMLRSASQVTYDNLQKQFDLMNQLQKQIDSAQNIKEAIDLQNRLLLEGNLIQLQLLRLASLSAYQQAISSQKSVNATVNQFNSAK